MFKMSPNQSYRLASVPQQFSKIKIIENSEVKIFDNIFVHAVINNNRLIRVLKDSVKYE